MGSISGGGGEGREHSLLLGIWGCASQQGLAVVVRTFSNELQREH